MIFCAFIQKNNRKEAQENPIRRRCSLAFPNQHSIFPNELKENTYFARIYLESGGKVIELDARPSDSIALALRMKAPIHTTEELLESASKIMPKTVTQTEEYDPEALRESLRKMNPEDFGKFSF